MVFPKVVDSPAIILATLNAKYIHASLGLRYLLANMGELRSSTALGEFKRPCWSITQPVARGPARSVCAGCCPRRSRHSPVQHARWLHDRSGTRCSPMQSKIET